MRGTVKRFDDKKGFGFIEPSDGGKDVFVHFTGIMGTGRRTLDRGEEVEFDLVEGMKGPQAQNVRRL